jgi:GAF domain-containing protein
MSHHVMHYETMLRVSRAITMSKDPEEVALITVESITTALSAKGCALFLINEKSEELEIAAAYGLSRDYLNKGPVSAIKSIAQSLSEGPIAIFDVNDDPRIQYPEEAIKEGIASILSVPMVSQGHLMGALRVYTADHWDFTLNDVNLVQALAQLAGMAIDMCRIRKGYKASIEVLKEMRDPTTFKTGKWTPFEGVPTSVSMKAAG